MALAAASKKKGTPGVMSPCKQAGGAFGCKGWPPTDAAPAEPLTLAAPTSALVGGGLRGGGSASVDAFAAGTAPDAFAHAFSPKCMRPPRRRRPSPKSSACDGFFAADAGGDAAGVAFASGGGAFAAAAPSPESSACDGFVAADAGGDAAGGAFALRGGAFAAAAFTAGLVASAPADCNRPPLRRRPSPKGSAYGFVAATASLAVGDGDEIFASGGGEGATASTSGLAASAPVTLADLMRPPLRLRPSPRSSAYGFRAAAATFAVGDGVVAFAAGSGAVAFAGDGASAERFRRWWWRSRRWWWRIRRWWWRFRRCRGARGAGGPRSAAPEAQAIAPELLK